MNGAHLHLLVNHVPVLGLFFGLALLVAALWRRSTELTRTSLVVFALTAVAAIVVYLTGEPAEDSVEGLAGVSRALIERHESAALAATIGVGVLGGVALVGLAGFRRLAAVPRWFTSSSLVLALATAGLMGWTANLGGQIRHTEIRAGAPAGDGGGGENREREEREGRGVPGTNAQPAVQRATASHTR